MSCLGWELKQKKQAIKNILFCTRLVILSTMINLWHFYDMCFCASILYNDDIYSYNCISIYKINILTSSQYVCVLCIYHCAKFFCDNERLLLGYARNFAYTQFKVTIISIDRFTFFNISDQIWHENDQNAKLIMNLSGTVCQLFHYFPGKQELVISLPGQALKSKQWQWQSILFNPYNTLYITYYSN